MVEPGTKAAVLRQCHDLERIAGGGFDQDRHHVPGWMVVEMLMRPPHDARDHGRVDTGKPRRQALRDAVNGSQLGVGRHASTLPQGSCSVNPAFVWSARRMWGQRLRTEARPAGPWRTANGDGLDSPRKPVHNSSTTPRTHRPNRSAERRSSAIRGTCTAAVNGSLSTASRNGRRVAPPVRASGDPLAERLPRASGRRRVHRRVVEPAGRRRRRATCAAALPAGPRHIDGPPGWRPGVALLASLADLGPSLGSAACSQGCRPIHAGRHPRGTGSIAIPVRSWGSVHPAFHPLCRACPGSRLSLPDRAAEGQTPVAMTAAGGHSTLSPLTRTSDGRPDR